MEDRINALKQSSLENTKLQSNMLIEKIFPAPTIFTPDVEPIQGKISFQQNIKTKDKKYQNKKFTFNYIGQVYYGETFTMTQLKVMTSGNRQIIAEGISRKSPNDQYSKKIGKQISLGRAESTLKMKLRGKEIGFIFKG